MIIEVMFLIVLFSEKATLSILCLPNVTHSTVSEHYGTDSFGSILLFCSCATKKNFFPQERENTSMKLALMHIVVDLVSAVSSFY